MSSSNPITLPAPDIGVVRDPPAGSPDKWLREYQAFQQLLPQLIQSHRGEYVVIHDCQVVDSGPDEVALALRFFAQQGKVPVHVGLVTDQPGPPARIPHYRESFSLGKGS